MQFTVKIIKSENIKNELEAVGFDECYIEQGADKHEFLTLKIQNVPPHVATIIKQTALSKGCDAAIHKKVLLHEINFSDALLSGTIKQLKEVANNLEYQPFGLKNVAKEIKKLIIKKRYTPSIMGILNITEDSFSDGGKFLDPKAAIIQANKLINDGAEIIDIGAESTRPGAKAIDVELEIKRLTPIVKEVKKLNKRISIDTRNSKTAEIMLGYGADIINDVSGLTYDDNMASVIKENNCTVVIMHSKGTPETMDNLASYNNLTDDVYNFLQAKINFLTNLGLEHKNIIIDVGFGFAKDIGQNFELLKKIQEFNSLGVQNLAGVSRKRFLKSLVNSNETDLLDEITMLASFYLFEQKTDIIRVHNVQKTKLALDFYNSIY